MDEDDVLKQVRKRLAGLTNTVDRALRKVPGVGRIVPGASEAVPSVDVYETPDAVVVRAQVPGVAREDLEVRTTSRTLIIKGRTPPEKYENYETVTRETLEGDFSREVVLPQEVDEEAGATAFLEDGVLTVRLKKAPPEKGKKVTVEMR